MINHGDLTALIIACPSRKNPPGWEGFFYVHEESVLAYAALLAMKHALHRTGRPPSLSGRGLNGTWQAAPHWAQTASCISRSPPIPPPPRWFLRASRQALQRWGADKLRSA